MPTGRFLVSRTLLAAATIEPGVPAVCGSKR